MSDARTEKPTPRRLREARKEGQGFTRSPEVAVAFSLLGAVLSLRLIGPGVVEGVVMETRRFFAASASPDPLAFVADRILPMVAGALVPFLAVAVVGGLAAGVAQTGIVFVPTAAKPRLKNLSLRRGLERLRPSRVAWDLMRSAVKMALLVALTWSSLEAWIGFLRSRHSLGVAGPGRGRNKNSVSHRFRGVAWVCVSGRIGAPQEPWVWPQSGSGRIRAIVPTSSGAAECCGTPI